MPADNHTVSDFVTFILTGIPGYEESHVWIAIPFCLIYVVTLFGNSLLLFIIVTEQSLHEPMYLFLSMLATADLLYANSTVPKMLALFWFRTREISFAACLTQMFFIHVSFLVDSAILLAMAFDRYVAICDPLRYTTMLTKSVIGKMGLAVVTRSFCIILPFIFIVKQLNFCKTKLVPYTFCDYLSITRLACDDVTVYIWYGVAMPNIASGLDAVLIAVSYGSILRAVFRLSSTDARLKALRTCSSHVCVILMFYTPSIFNYFLYPFVDKIPVYFINLMAILYIIIPPMLNPIVYAVTTKEILKRVINVFYPCCRKSSLLS